MSTTSDNMINSCMRIITFIFILPFAVAAVPLFIVLSPIVYAWHLSKVTNTNNKKKKNDQEFNIFFSDAYNDKNWFWNNKGGK